MAHRVESMLSLSEIETQALERLSPKAISYYASAAGDEITKSENNKHYQSILLRPRIFVDCSTCNINTTILGHRIGLPVYISPAAQARLAHSDGESAIAAACSKFKSLQIISHNASQRPEDIVRSAPSVVFAWQLYVLKDIEKTENIIRRINKIPQIRFIVLTLDAPFPGKREADERFKTKEAQAGNESQAWGTEAGLTWTKTLPWLASQTHLPIVLKGIQSHEDALLATHFPAVKAIILSNHGGRALDTAVTPVQLLLEIHRFCPQVFEKVEMLVDGGIKRGTDVVKALALGAKAVGIGRAALYGLAVGGQAGVERTLQSTNLHSYRKILVVDCNYSSSRRNLHGYEITWSGKRVAAWKSTCKYTNKTFIICSPSKLISRSTLGPYLVISF